MNMDRVSDTSYRVDVRNKRLVDGRIHSHYMAERGFPLCNMLRNEALKMVGENIDISMGLTLPYESLGNLGVN